MMNTYMILPNMFFLCAAYSIISMLYGSVQIMNHANVNLLANEGGGGVELYAYKQHVSPPVYLEVWEGTGINIPVGGGNLRYDPVFLYSQFYGTTNTVLMEYTNLQVASSTARYTETYINTQNDLIQLGLRYGINLKLFPITLPIKAVEYKWNDSVWADVYSGVISDDPGIVALSAAWARLPFFSVVGLCITLFVCTGLCIRKYKRD
jgi:hypothetical protein